MHIAQWVDPEQPSPNISHLLRLLRLRDLDLPHRTFLPLKTRIHTRLHRDGPFPITLYGIGRLRDYAKTACAGFCGNTGGGGGSDDAIE